VNHWTQLTLTRRDIAALVNPAASSKGSFLAVEEPLETTVPSDEWESKATRHEGSWWNDYAEWLGARSGQTIPAPESLGSARYQVIEAAPGSYVLDS
jgi:polyhydroxyalkanoate synthase